MGRASSYIAFQGGAGQCTLGTPAPVQFHFQEAAPELWGTLNSHCQENTISAKMKRWEEAAFLFFPYYF